MLISEGVGRAHHDGTMETAGAQRSLPGCAQTPSALACR